MQYNNDYLPRTRTRVSTAGGIRWSGPDDLRRLSTAFDATSDGPFSATVWTESVGPILVSRYRGTGLTIERTERHLADMFMSHLRLTVPSAGVISGAQADNEFTVSEGQAAAVRFDQPFSTSTGDDVDIVEIYLPVSSLVVRDINPNGIAGRSWNLSATARTAVDFVSALLRQPTPVAPGQTDMVADILSGIALLIVADGVDPVSAPPVSREMDLRLRAFSVIDARFTDPDLSPDAVAAALHVSPRSLFRAFEESGTTVGRLIQQRRLSRVAMALERESSTKTIAALAHANGFHGADQLTRAFRKQFGTTPSEFRTRRRADQGINTR